MIIFIFGEDIYQSQKRLIELKAKFKEKYGDINVSIFDIEKKSARGGSALGGETNAPKIISEIESMPFLGAKRLIIIKNSIANSDPEAKEKIIKKIASIPESSIVIFYEKGIPKKNDKLFKLFLKSARVEEFTLRRTAELVDWIKKEVGSRKGEIETEAAQKLVQLSGADTWKISNEIDKLINYSYPQTIKKEDVLKLTLEKVEAGIFDLVDALARRDGRSALLFLHRLLSLGEKREYLFSMIVYGFRNLILVKYLSENREDLREFEIAQKLKMHPFVAKKAIGSARLFSFIELKKIYRRLVLANSEMRRSNKNPVLILDLLLSEICVR